MSNVAQSTRGLDSSIASGANSGAMTASAPINSTTLALPWACPCRFGVQSPAPRVALAWVWVSGWVGGSEDIRGHAEWRSLRLGGGMETRYGVDGDDDDDGGWGSLN